MLDGIFEEYQLHVDHSRSHVVVLQLIFHVFLEESKISEVLVDEVRIEEVT